MICVRWEGNGLNLLFSNFAVLFGIHLLFAKRDCKSHLVSNLFFGIFQENSLLSFISFAHY